MTRQRQRQNKPLKQTAQTTLVVNASLYGRKNNRIEKIEIQPFESEPAYVRAGAGVTRSLGDYESLRVDVSISVPCYTEEVDQVYLNLADKVSELLDEEVSRYIDGEREEEIDENTEIEEEDEDEEAPQPEQEERPVPRRRRTERTSRPRNRGN